MMPDPVQIVSGLGSPPVLGWVIWRAYGRVTSFYWSWMMCATGGVIGAVTPPPVCVASAVASGASLILAAVLWWLSRRRKRRVPKLAGAKSRVLLAAVVRTMRERARPRPVLRPVPGGAR